MNAPTGRRILDPLRYVFLRTPTSFQHRVLHAFGREAPWTSGSPPVAPPAPEGMRTGAPDFVGIGAAKSGTTWWFSLLMSHPQIHVEYEKELNYFNEQFLKRLDAGKVTLADAEAYHDWFPRPEGTITGEWTPHYAFASRLPPVLRVAAPGARLIVMLRDPVERYRSDLSRRMPPKALERLRYRSLANSMYANVLKPWEEAYAPEDLLVLQFEACIRSPADYLAETFRFLGVDDTFRPPEVRAPINTSKKKLGVDPFVVQQLVRLYAPDVLRLVARRPSIDLSLWPNFAHLANSPIFPAPPT
jgi:Sulfotransferase domain